MPTTVNPMSRQAPDRNLAMELVRVTEAAALAAARWVVGATRTAPTGPRSRQCARSVTVTMDGVVVIGEGEKDKAPMLYNGERSATARHHRST